MTVLREIIRKIYYFLPLPNGLKRWIKDVCFAVLTPFIKNTNVYKNWCEEKGYESFNNQVSLMGINNKDYLNQIISIPFTKKNSTEYEKDIDNDCIPIITEDDVKYIAFYLPQYHAFKENDLWWGKGFTEWTNVTKTVPQFAGHYQPRLADEFGYYDLHYRDNINKQILAAKKYGIYGFCIYYYWFDGEHIMDTPLEIIFNDSSLNIPFCLCWANENWTRRWDGKNNDVLKAQTYNEEFPYRFIREIKKYLNDSRYIRVNNKPIVVIYNANQIPRLKEVLKIWRNYARDNGIGELHILAVDFSLTLESKNAGFDGFVEFPPHSVSKYGLNTINDDVDYISTLCHSNVFDYGDIVKEKKYLEQDLEHYKGIFLEWDNTSRCPFTATIFHRYSTKLFKEWLTDISIYTKNTRKKGDRFVFINAWNEWAEGTYLEPDAKYGYSNLKAVRDTLLSVRNECRKIIVVGHDACFNGAQLLLLNIVRNLKTIFHFDVYTILLKGGELKSQYEHESDDLYCIEDDGIESLEKWICKKNVKKAICNTVVTGDIMEILVQQDIQCISMIHEMKNVIKQYSCEKKLEKICKYASSIVVASEYVSKDVEKIYQIPKEKKVICPQGMFKINQMLSEKKQFRELFEKEYGIPATAFLVIGVGWGDYRKGIDLFIKVSKKVFEKNKKVYFMWVGDIAQEMHINVKDSRAVGCNMVVVGKQKEVMPFYAASDLFLLTSREDPFPTVVMEAMNSKMPVIAFKGGGGYVENIFDGTGILVEMEDCSQMAEAVLMYASSPEKIKNDGNTAKKYVDEKYNFISYMFEILKLLGFDYEKVSVVVPNYNYARYLTERLESIINQTYPIYEIILLDDCSTDNSIEIEKKYERIEPLRLKLIRNQQNSGKVFYQWKKGLLKTKGEYVWIAEADDLAQPQMIERLIEKMKNNPETTVSYCQSKMINEEGEVTSDNYWIYTDDIDDSWHMDYEMNAHHELVNHLSVKNTIPNVSAVLLKNRDFTEALTEAMKYNVAGDWAFYTKLLEKGGKIAFCAESLNYHRRHNGSVTNDLKAKKHFEEICEMQDKIMKEYPDEINKDKVYAYRKKVKEMLGV